MAIVRLNEPFYRHLLYKEFASWFGQFDPDDDDLVSSKKKKKNKKSKEDDANSIKKNTAAQLMSARLSIDLLYTILYGITEHTVGHPKNIDWKNYQAYDFTNLN